MAGTAAVVEFPDMETARRRYSSPEYAEALEARGEALDRRLLFVEGLDEERRATV